MHQLEKQIIKYEDFKNKSQAEQKAILTDYRIQYTNKEIENAWNITTNTLYRLVDKLELPKAARKNFTKSSTNNKKETTSLPVEPPKTKITQNPTTAYKDNGLTLSFNGKQTADNIINRLEKISLLLTEEEANFEISLTIKELAKK